jgi:hypothetical protein
LVPKSNENADLMRKINVTIIATLLAVASCFANQASLIAEIKNNPTEDLSTRSSDDLQSLGEADGMAYFHDHLTYKIGKEDFGSEGDGMARAFKHNLIGMTAFIYSASFYDALNTLALGTKYNEQLRKELSQ